MTPEERAQLEAILGHHFENPERLERALIHRSHRQTSNGVDNERLEFLGDRVLGLVASEQLCRSFPEWDSGKLSKGLARLVNASSIPAAASCSDATVSAASARSGVIQSIFSGAIPCTRGSSTASIIGPSAAATVLPSPVGA